MIRVPQVAGFLLALFLLSGRWGIERLSEGQGSPLFELRLWITLVFLLIVGIFSWIKRERETIPKNTLLYRFLIFSIFGYLLYMVISTAWSPEASLAVEKSYEILLILLIIFGLGLLSFVMDLEEVANSFLASVVFIGMAMAVMAVILLYRSSTGRLAILGGGPNVFGRIMGYLCIGGLYFWRTSKFPVPWLAATFMAGALVLLSGSRGAMLACAAACLGYFFLERIRMRKVFGFVFAGVVFSLCVMIFTGFWDVLSKVGEERVVKLLFVERYGSGREFLYATAFEMGSQRLLAGWGLAAFSMRYPGWYPHNIFLETFSEGGMLGLGFLSLFLSLSFLSFRRRGRGMASTLFCFWILLFVAAQFSGDLYDSRGLFLFPLIAGFPGTKTDPISSSRTL